MKILINFFTLTNKYFYWMIFIGIIFILTLTNNYYFYSHVERSSTRDAQQLKLLLDGNINYCQSNTIGISNCNELLQNTIRSFSLKAYYNDSITINGQNINEFKLFDKVSKSDINITLPSENLSEFKFDFKASISYAGVLNSVLKSMTFSIYDIINISYEKGIKVALEKFATSYWYRSRPVVIFSIIIYFILWISRKRSYKIKKLQILEEEKIYKDFEENIKLQSNNDKQLINNVKLKISTFKNIISPPFNFNNIEQVFDNELDTIGTRFRKVAEKIIFDIYEKKIGPIDKRIDLSTAIYELNKNKIISEKAKNYLSIVRIYGNISSHYSKNTEITREEAIAIASSLMIVIEEFYEQGLFDL